MAELNDPRTPNPLRVYEQLRAMPVASTSASSPSYLLGVDEAAISRLLNAERGPSKSLASQSILGEIRADAAEGICAWLAKQQAPCDREAVQRQVRRLAGLRRQGELTTRELAHSIMRMLLDGEGSTQGLPEYVYTRLLHALSLRSASSKVSASVSFCLDVLEDMASRPQLPLNVARRTIEDCVHSNVLNGEVARTLRKALASSVA